MVNREELNQYSDEELALRFANDEGLYQSRHNTWVDTIAVALECFTFTDAQLDELKDWWDDYQEEDE